MYRTAEFVTPKHPDKLCDRISDAILDACLKEDANARVAVESMGGHGIITITGEITAKREIDLRKAVKSVIDNDIGIQINVVKQSLEISSGVDRGGAGDQGIMIGYACNENPEMLPQEYYLARSLCKFIYNKCAFDGKTQVTLKDMKVVSIVASFQNTPSSYLKELIYEWMRLTNISLIGTQIFVNPAGDWNLGGFDADTGVTGRKLAVDNFGPRIPIGGGAFSGKDASKVDRSGAYMARRIAVDYLNKYKAKEVYVRLAYAIGVSEPIKATAYVDGKEMIIINYDLTPTGIIKFLNLTQPIYEKTACWGHFGNNFNWDKERL